MTSFKCTTLFLIGVVAVVIAFFAYVDQPSHWVYDPVRLQQIVQQSIATANAANGGNATAKQVTGETIRLILENYPKTTRYTGRWLWNNAGGAMGSMTVLHCSFSEYLIIFGSSVGTEGHTGRFFWADDFFNILVGEQWAALPGVEEREVYRPGDQHILPRGAAKQYRMPDECWALEYARGNIVSMLFFGFADMFSSTLDVVTIYQTVMESAGNMIANTLMGKI
ncbi:C-8 sterol isomerase-like protein [Leishmania major strain Friedlin]|uniref:C-8 sterol isomerase-like protein n=1 Tax=Leishmania major TaxID=5664 RepID=E9AE76_LEIMA|nr:C-8 sterol isomerase-like protein [Leishmania major strain Friedlin]CAG9577955.1 C-8_sterol_isomerase-like_protein [Leishmania major strain Friedlin]CBZ12555.1 C-8 sterol isomerase-like protein [Leishmania major strain Friedlin]|eukprot:XP_003722297.1 C-8 sterol isomerase-like protein [Leishmania major strain Friedlin]